MRWIIIMIIVMALTACSSSIDSKNAQIMDKILDLEKVPHTDIKVDDGVMMVYYETSYADDYDTQLVGDWGSIFGAGANFGYDSTAIINTVNDEEMVRLTAKNQDTLEYVTGVINDTEFWSRVEIKSLS
jgi:hypothetical protein